MKVLVLISGGDTGGAKTHVLTLLAGLNRHIQADMICFVESDFTRDAREMGIRTEVLSGKNIFAVLRTLQERIQAGGYDLIHCHGSRGNLMGALMKRRTGLPVVTTIHSDPRLDYMGRPLAGLVFGTLNRWALRKIRYHIGVSRTMGDLMIQRGLDPQQMFSIYNGIDTHEDHTPKLTRQAFLESLGLRWPEDAVIAGIAARLNPVKDMGTLLRGFAEAHAVQPRLRLILAGDGADEQMLKQLAADLGVSDSVCFAGWLTDTDSFYNALDINTLTSLSETFPYALTEASRFCLPAVATRVGGVPDLIEHGVNGYLFEPKDYKALGRFLAQLTADDELRHRMGENLHEKVCQKFSIEATIQTQLDIYQSVLNRHQREHSRRDGAVICGAYGQENLGDEAVLRAIIAEMRSIDPDMPLWVMTKKPRETRLMYRVGTVYTFNIPGFCRKMRRSKVYLNGGGSLIQDVTSRRSLAFYLLTLKAGRQFGCKVLMYGCGIGPVNSKSGRKLAAKVINRCVSLITLRDSQSMAELKQMGVTEPEMHLSADPAVTLAPATPEAAESVLEDLGLHPSLGEHYLGITVRPWDGVDQKLDAFAAVAEYAYKKYNLIPVFIPIETRLDLKVSQQVMKRIHEIPAVVVNTVIPTDYTIALFRRMDVVISMRLHALIFSAGQGVPLVGVVYDPKVSAFLDAAQQDLYLPLEDVTGDRLIRLLDQAAARRQDRAGQEARTARLMELERINRDCARKLLEEP